jgi:activator of HSP90 ATPase
MIYGIGLPRTGSTTLAEALRILGYRGSNFCSLTFSINIESNEQFSIDNSYYKVLSELIIDAEKDDLFILTTRKDVSWKRSIKSFNVSDNIPLPTVYEDTVRACIPKNNLLVVNWKYDSWPALCSFLNKEIPYDKFPCENC